MAAWTRQELLNAGRRLRDQLSEIADDIDKHEENVRIARISGESASAVGGGMAIAGLIFLPFTFGLSAGLYIGGAAVGTAGGLTASGAAITGLIINKEKRDDVEKAWRAFEGKFYEHMANVNNKQLLNIITGMHESFQEIVKTNSPSSYDINQLVKSIKAFLLQLENM